MCQSQAALPLISKEGHKETPKQGSSMMLMNECAGQMLKTDKVVTQTILLVKICLVCMLVKRSPSRCLLRFPFSTFNHQQVADS